MIEKNKIRIKGFTLLIAVIVSGLFLAIGATIYRIALVELILSSVGRESQFAFYSADTGAECALYWNYKYTDAFSGGTTDQSGSAFSVYNDATGDENGSSRNLILSGTLNDIECAQDPDLEFRAGDVVGGTSNQTYFKIDASGICAEVVVTKFPDVGQPPTRTEIISHGYNLPCVANDRRVERAIRVVIE